MNSSYQEKVFSGLLSILPGCFAVAMLGLFIYYQIAGPDDELSNWFFLGMGIFFLLISINFAFLIVTVSPAGVSARFGVFSHTTPVNDIAGFYQDKTSSISYGGFGIRFTWVNGKRRLVYNVTNAPRIVLQQQPGSNREFVFSTRNVEGVMQAIKDVTGKMS